GGARGGGTGGASPRAPWRPFPSRPVPSRPTVVPFEEVWSRSYCRARETLVDVLQEFPHEAEHIFKPPCVPLWRCAGCCGDESLECTPTETRTVELQVGAPRGSLQRGLRPPAAPPHGRTSPGALPRLRPPLAAPDAGSQAPELEAGTRAQSCGPRTRPHSPPLTG
uniref:Platelet-derived growth factor (PDGF) family profile domain-containing protein n=1 Tax=Varanus komodoensis TaxID=61221 RepID=A0A8D2JJA1_VARKO